MDEIKRDYYLKRLISADGNGFIKVITGIRRAGKSYLLDPMFTSYLKLSGVEESQIIKIDFDTRENQPLHNADAFLNYLEKKISTNLTSKYYILLDEVQYLEDFSAVLLSLQKRKNLEIYVTGSNSRFLSSEVPTEFRGRGYDIHVYPLSFEEILPRYNSKDEAWGDYIKFGGLPQVVLADSEIEKRRILSQLSDNIYINDILDRHKIENRDALETLIKIISSSIGSLTNPSKLEKIFYDNYNTSLTDKTIYRYLKYLEDAFIIKKSERFDIKGKKYIKSLSKYYFTDIGIRNHFTNFRQIEESHIMENIIYNELLLRDFSVDVGLVEISEDNKRKKLEADFVCNQGSQRYYIQSALRIPDTEKRNQETKSLRNIDDSFKKIIISRDFPIRWYDENGILNIPLFEFLETEDVFS